ncbi:trehalase-like isoform X2 [Rhodnius prolixus]|uniref:trehalase-like isoform X2 n=1 Tax=Rhodnius prolixus TaxID=13249 RepID=UPI003D18F993
MNVRHIFNSGDLLQAAQMSEVFADQETFFEKKLKYPVIDVLDNFYNLKKEFGGTLPSTEAMKSFIEDNFEDVSATEHWIPQDWTEEPEIFDRVRDKNLKKWALQLNQMWKTLGRKVSQIVVDNPDLFATYCLPNGFMTTEKKMNSMYYWSTYWLINGLLVCGMFNTAKGIIDNLLYLIDQVGHIPTSSKCYYEGRTKPPLLAYIFNLFLRYTGDFEYIKSNVKYVIKEIEFWDKERAIEIEYKGEIYELYRYWRKRMGPRPEKYRDDYSLASLGTSRQEMTEIFIALQSAAESGWYFSSRWINVRGDNKGNISDTYTHSIIPVDLNAIIHGACTFLYYWHRSIGDFEYQSYYRVKSEKLLKGIENVLWNEKHGTWLDYDIVNKKSRKFFYLSNLTPLWTKSYTFPVNKLTHLTSEYLNRYFMDKYEGGLPVSVEYSGEKWDFPNSWPPLQACVIQGFDNLGTEDGTNIAFHFAEKWINNVYKGYSDTGQLFEKYDSLMAGNIGDTHNYEPTEGFGHTLGLVFELLERWGPSLRVS